MTGHAEPATTLVLMEGHERSFGGFASALPVPISRGSALYVAGSSEPKHVRHATGYSEFAIFVESRGEDAANLAARIRQLMGFIQSHAPDIATNATLTTSAVRFLGNALVQLQADAHWRTYEGSGMTVGDSRVEFDVDAVLARLLSGDRDDDRLVALILTWGKA